MSIQASEKVGLPVVYCSKLPASVLSNHKADVQMDYLPRVMLKRLNDSTARSSMLPSFHTEQNCLNNCNSQTQKQLHIGSSGLPRVVLEDFQSLSDKNKLRLKNLEVYSSNTYQKLRFVKFEVILLLANSSVCYNTSAC